jgi:hypothetical protein
MTTDTTPDSPLTANPRPRVTTIGWLTGAAVIVLAWALVVALFGFTTGSPWDVARDPRVIVLFVLLLCAWTGLWFAGSRNPPPFSFA